MPKLGYTLRRGLRRGFSMDRRKSLRNESVLSQPLTSGHKETRVSLASLSTPSLLRSLFLGYCFASPRLLSVSLRIMDRIVHSNSSLLNPDRNIVLGTLLRSIVYNQFCAGTNPAEVKRSVADIKAMGYDGVILGYGREIVLDDETEGQDLGQEKEGQNFDPHIAAWLDGNLKTLDCIGEDDYMNVKYTGAGEAVSKALIEQKAPPKQLVEALDAICKKAASQNSRIWIDAEQKIFQDAIDKWTINLMRVHNRNGKALVSNTIQAYLKDSRQNVVRNLQVAQAEGWTLGIKLVRGAYIQQDNREYIWDTKAETDANYNSIARDLLSKDFSPVEQENFPNVHLFLAGHNKESIRLLSAHYQQLVRQGVKLNPVAFGQLQGMADEVGCELIQLRKAALEREPVTSDNRVPTMPRAYKCLNWGTIRECMHFLMRRVVENASATERLQDGLSAVKTELKSRLLFGK